MGNSPPKPARRHPTSFEIAGLVAEFDNIVTKYGQPVAHNLHHWKTAQERFLDSRSNLFGLRWLDHIVDLTRDTQNNYEPNQLVKKVYYELKTDKLWSLQTLEPETTLDRVNQIMRKHIVYGAPTLKYGMLEKLFGVLTSKMTEPEANMICWCLQLLFRRWVRLSFSGSSIEEWAKQDEYVNAFHIFQKYLRQPISQSSQRHLKASRIIQEEDCRNILRLLLQGDSIDYNYNFCRDNLLASSISITECTPNSCEETVSSNTECKSPYFIVSSTKHIAYACADLEQLPYEESPSVMLIRFKEAGYRAVELVPHRMWSHPAVLEHLRSELQVAVAVNKEIKKNRKEYTDDTQELLFVAFYTHGVQGHVMDDTKTYIQYEVILDILNETLDLRIMPKVKPL